MVRVGVGWVFFFQAEDGIRDLTVTGVQTCALPIYRAPAAGMGVIVGVVKETEFDEPLIEAPVQIVGRKNQALTDLEGRYRLELPPGTRSEERRVGKEGRSRGWPEG